MFSMFVKAPSIFPAFVSIQLFYDVLSTVEVIWHRIENGRMTTNDRIRGIWKKWLCPILGTIPASKRGTEECHLHVIVVFRAVPNFYFILILTQCRYAERTLLYFTFPKEILKSSSCRHKIKWTGFKWFLGSLTSLFHMQRLYNMKWDRKEISE
jgi:hypothetical protein